MEPIAVYVHSPFCPSKCGYCDFNSYALGAFEDSAALMERTAEAMKAEILRSPWRGRPAKTIFFGGGTPTYFEERQLLGILEAVIEAHPPLPGAEVTSEANPGTVDSTKFRAMRRAGFNRVSLGAQSFQDGDLVRLDRVHQSGDIGRAVEAAREAGFDNLNLDLMFALPGQSRFGWRQNLDRVFELKPDHLSLYCLTIEPNTAFYRKHLRGELDLPDDEEQVAMYEECLDRAATEGFAQYEISNFARPGRECAHNLCYWRGEDYAGYGPGAVGCVDGVRATNLKHPVGYCEAVEAGRPLACESETLDAETRRMERIMLGLRLDAGLPTEGLNLPERALEKLVSRGWLEVAPGRVRLTRDGKHFCSEVALELVGT